MVKRTILPVVAVALMLVAFIFLAHATPTIIAGAPAVVNNTTSNFPASPALAYNPADQQWSVTHGALQQTTDISIKFFATLQNSTNSATQVYWWYPSTTNAATEIIYAGTFTLTNYTYPQVITTNSQSMYISHGQ